MEIWETENRLNSLETSFEELRVSHNALVVSCDSLTIERDKMAIAQKGMLKLIGECIVSHKQVVLLLEESNGKV